MNDRRSLRYRLNLLYTTFGASVLSLAGLAGLFVVYAIVTRPLVLSLAEAAHAAEAAATTAPRTVSTLEVQKLAVLAGSRDGVKLIIVPAESMRYAPTKIPSGDVSVLGLFGLNATFVHVRDAEIVVIPDDRRIEGLLRSLFAFAGVIVALAIVVARFIARIVTRQALAPLLTVTAELERFAAGDFSPRPLTIADRTELGALAAAYNGAAQQVTQAFTERRRVEEQIRQFVAEAGHELRTPLTVVAGYVDVLRRGGDADSTIRRNAFASLGSELRRMRTLVERLMTLARLDRTTETQPEFVDLVAIAGQVVDALAITSNVPIRLETPHDLVILGEPGDVYEAIANLVENALKYGAGSAVSVRLSTAGNEIAVRVSDGGPGIPEGHRTRVFERFYRCTDRGEIAGSGLGLAIAAKAAERLAGRLLLEDARAGSTTFALIVPALSGVESAWTPLGAPARASHVSGRALGEKRQ